MGQSYVIGMDMEIEVRDSTFELVLDHLLVEVERSPPDDTRDSAARTVRAWGEYWASMPPGCKELDVREVSEDVRALLSAMLAKLQDAAPAGSETVLVAQRLGALLRAAPG